MKNFPTQWAIALTILLFPYTAVAQAAHNMSLLSNWDDSSVAGYSDIWGYTVGGREFAIMGSRTKVHFVEVTDPDNLDEVASFTPGSNTSWRDMKTYQTYAYAVSDVTTSEGLLVFDMTNITGPDPVLPGDPPRVKMVNQIITHFTRSHNIFIEQSTGFLYAVGVNSSYNLIIYDLKPDPANPTLHAQLNMTCGYSHDIFVEGNIAFTSSETRGHYIYNMSPVLNAPANNPSGAPIELARIDNYQFEGYSHSSWRSGNRMVFADETHGSPLAVVDVSDLTEPEVRGRFHSNLLGVANPTSSTTPRGPIVHNPFLVGNLCYVSHYHDGVVVFDISDPNNVQRVAYYDTHTSHTNYNGYDGCWGVYPFLPSGRIIASDILNGLFVLQPAGAALPVTWVDFQAKNEDKSVRLDWKTGVETNNRGFHIQRQNTGDTDWETLGFVPASTTQQYQFWDEQPKRGWNTYRLVQEDYDGTQGISKWVNVFVADGQTAWRLVNSPVTDGYVRFTYTAAAMPHEAISLRLYDGYGRMVAQQSLPPQPQLTLFIGNLPDGLYWYELESGRGTASGSLVLGSGG